MLSIVRREESEKSKTVILADVSESMAGDNIRRLKGELFRLWPEVTGRILAFNDRVQWCDAPAELPEPFGGTDMKLALETAAKVWPSKVVIISDGEPQDEEGALQAASGIPGIIDVLFVGPESNRSAADFLRRLAKLGGGIFAQRDLAKNMSITGELRKMLALPGPIAL
jgi:hypothetical protein